jgi:general secretion pathway protein J
MARSPRNAFCIERPDLATRGGGASAGFTLIEVVVALALFALIAAAGAALVSTVLDAERHTAGRLDRLADAERAMALVTRDLTEIADAPLVGSAAGIAFERHRVGAGAGGGAGVAYRFADGRFDRVAAGRPQTLLDHVAGVHWHYYAQPSGWRDQWPGTPAEAQGWPMAVVVEIDLAGPPPNGRLRRIVDLPLRPLPLETGVAGQSTAAVTAP